MAGMDPARMGELRRLHYNAAVARVREVVPGLRILRIRPDGAPVDYTPGQYLALGLGLWEARVDGIRGERLPPGGEGELMVRHYSFSHPILDERGAALAEPGSLDGYEFYISMPEYAPDDTEPRLTPRLFSLEEGDRLHAGREPAGEYTGEALGPEENVLFVATGTGEAPHNAILWRLLSRGHRGRLASLVSTRRRAEQGYRGIHRRLESLYPGYRYLGLATREPGEEGGRTHVQDYLESGSLERELGWRLDPGSTRVFLCGHPDMIGVPKQRPGSRVYPTPTGMIELLERRGFNADSRSGGRINIHYERFW